MLKRMLMQSSHTRTSQAWPDPCLHLTPLAYCSVSKGQATPDYVRGGLLDVIARFRVRLTG